MQLNGATAAEAAGRVTTASMSQTSSPAGALGHLPDTQEPVAPGSCHQ